ncbi:MAG: hypothetical protein J6Y10_10225 [Lachnospiraceae bacterium]|nr:hypothetical protein [Lachnospiraceae bacterium]
MASDKKAKKSKKVSVPGMLIRLVIKLGKAAGKTFLLILKILPFASMCVDRFGGKESSS